MCGFMPVLWRYFCLCSVQLILLVLCAVFMLVDCAVCSTLLAPLVAGASRPQGPLRGPRNCTHPRPCIAGVISERADSGSWRIECLSQQVPRTEELLRSQERFLRTWNALTQNTLTQDGLSQRLAGALSQRVPLSAAGWQSLNLG